MEINLNSFPSCISTKKKLENEFIRDYVLQEIKEFYNEIADIQVYDHWLDFARNFKDYHPEPHRLFRGQSNDLNYQKLNFWQMQSNFNRSAYKLFGLNAFLVNLISSRNYISNYGVRLRNQIENSNLIDLMAFLQHQGIPTPLIDFTTDPITAFYFALSVIPFKPIYSQALYHSVFEIDSSILKECYSLNDMIINQQINNVDILDFLSGYRVELEPELNGSNLPIVGLCNHPDQKYNLVNTKLEKQDGAFIFFHAPKRVVVEGKIHDDITLEGLLKILRKRTDTRKKAMVLHLIPYKSIIDDVEGVFYPHDLLYTYFKLKGKTGLKLFEDITGFKYDFLFNPFKNYTNVNPGSHDFDQKLTEVLTNKGVI